MRRILRIRPSFPGRRLVVLLSRGYTVVVARLLLKHRGDGCKFTRYWKKERLPDSQQSSFR